MKFLSCLVLFLHSFVQILIFLWHHFLFSWRIIFNISFSVDQWMTNSYRVCMSGKIFISLLFSKILIPGLEFYVGNFVFSVKMLFHWYQIYLPFHEFTPCLVYPLIFLYLKVLPFFYRVIISFWFLHLLWFLKTF